MRIGSRVKEDRSLASTIFWVVLSGTLLAFVLAVPLELVWVTHAAGHYLYNDESLKWPIRIGFSSLSLVPIIVAGNAIFTSLEKARQQEVPLKESQKELSFIQRGFDNKDIVSVWQSCLEMQKHFNDLELRIRNFAVTLLVAVVSGTAFALKDHQVVQLGSLSLSLALPILIAGMLGWSAFYCMDRYWYHQLLAGAVKHSAERIEEPFSSFSPLGLTKRVSAESPTLFWKLPKPIGARTHFLKIHSSQKVDLFYAAGLIFLTSLINTIVFGLS